MEDWKIVLITIALMLLVLPKPVFADAQTTTIYWYVPASVSHTLSYDSNCSGGSFYFNGPSSGTDTNMVPYDDTSSTNLCQAPDTSAITVTNGGNVIIDVNAYFTTTLQTGVTFKLFQGSSGCGGDLRAGYESSCSVSGASDATVPTTTTCVNVGDANVQVLADIAVSGTGELCMAADFSSVSEGTASDTLETWAWQSAG